MISLKAKTWRRLATLSIALVLICALGVGGYAIRRSQLNARLVAGRAQGMEAFKANDYDTALHKVGAYLQRHPDDVEGLFVYCVCLTEVEDKDGKNVSQALAGFRQLLSLQPEHTEAAHKLLELLVNYELNTEAIDSASALLARDPNDLPALRAKALSLSRTRKFPEAIAAAAVHHKLRPLDIEMQGLTMQVMSAQGRPIGDIVKYAKQLLAAHPDAPQGEALLSVAQHVAGDDAEAVRLLRSAAKRKIDEVEFALFLASRMEALDLFDESLIVLQTAAAGGDVRIRRQVALRLLQAEQFDEVARRLADVDPANTKSDSDLLAIRAIALARSGRHELAAPLIAAIQSRGTDLIKTDAAAKSWAPLLQAAGGSTDGIDDSKLLVATESAVKTSNNPYAWLLRGDALDRLGEQDMAFRSWQQAATISRAWSAPLIRLSRMLNSIGRYDQAAVKVATDARQRAPRDPAALTELMTALDGALRFRPTPVPAGAPEVAQLDEVIDACSKSGVSEERLLAPRARTIALKDGLPAATKFVTAAVSGEHSLAEATYIQLAVVSDDFQLGISDTCLDAANKALGNTPDAAFTRAMLLNKAGKAPEGLNVLETARSDANCKGDLTRWDLNWATYLDAVRDPRAKEAWIHLADSQPNNIAIQWRALNSASVQTEREFQARVVGALSERIGAPGAQWKIAKARLVLTGAPSQPELIQMTELLSGIVRTAPDYTVARLLLANCLERLGNVPAALEQLTAASDSANRTPSLELGLARLLQARGEVDQSIAHLDRLAGMTEATLADRKLAAAMLLRHGESARALKILGAVDAGPAAKPPGQAGPAIEPSLELASAYLQTGDVTKAGEVCDALLKEPTDAAIELAADVYAAAGRTADAERALAALDRLTLSPGRKEAIRGMYLTRHGDPTRGIELLESAVKVAPADTTVWEWLIRSQLAVGAADKAIEAAGRASVAVDKADDHRNGFAALTGNADAVRKITAESSGPLLVAGLLDPLAREPSLAVLRTAVSTGSTERDRKQTLQQLRAVADQNPTVLGIQTFVISRLLPANQTEAALSLTAKADQTEAALELASRASQQFPTEPAPPALACKALALLGRWKECLAAAEKWRARSALRPQEPDLYRASALIALGRADEAAESLKPYLGSPPPVNSSAAANADSDNGGDRVRLVYATALVAGGRHEEASRQFADKLAGSQPWRAFWIQCGGTAIADISVAAEWLDRAAKTIPQDNLGEHVDLAWKWRALARRSNRPEDRERADHIRAETNALLANAKGAQDAQPLIALASLNETAADAQTAEQLYRSALKLDPNNPIAKNNLASLLAQQADRLDESLAFAMSAASTEHPNQPDFRETLATVQEKRNQFPDAIQTLKLALQVRPREKAWQIRLAGLLLETGDVGGAEAVLKVAEGLEPREADLPQDVREKLTSLRSKLAKSKSQFSATGQ